MPEISPLPPDYAAWLAELKTRIHSAQQRAALAVNRELVLLYWQLGRDILERQDREGWGARVIARLVQDLRKAFPDMKGFSPRNLKYLRPRPDQTSQWCKGCLHNSLVRPTACWTFGAAASQPATEARHG